MSVSSVLSIARSALSVQQVVIQTAGQNIANVETEGYSRQRVTINAKHPQQWPFGAVGTGVRVDDVHRVRNELLDVTWRRESAGASAAGARSELLSGIEGILGEPSDTGLASALDQLWSSWSDLATQPTSQAARSVVLQRAQHVATTLNGFDQRLRDLTGQASLRLTNALSEINTLADQVAKINGDIVSAEVNGRQAPDLRDARDRAIDQLSRLGEVRVVPNHDGSTQVLFGNNLVVDGVHAKHFQVSTDEGPGTGIALVTTPSRRLLPMGGEVGALVRQLNGGLTEVQQDLDRLANGLATMVNAIHAEGVGSTGAAGAAIFVDKTDGQSFDPAGNPFAGPGVALGTVTARTIGVNRALLADPKQLATSSSASALTANDVALAVASLRERNVVTVGGSEIRVRYVNRDGTWPDYARTPVPDPVGPPPGEFYRAVVGGLATQAKEALTDTTVRQTLAEQADQRRLSDRGVNLDEELTNLMRAQQAYAAAAKVISAADEMMKTLTSMV